MTDQTVIVSDHDIVVVEVPHDSVVVLADTSVVATGADTTEQGVLTQTDLVVLEPTAELLVLEEPQTIAVVTMGEQGPPGAPGAGSGAIEINFAYGDATPSQLVVAPAGKLIYSVAIHIRQSFDGTDAALTIGDAANPDQLMAAIENAPALVGSNTTSPAFAYDVDTQLLLSITPGAGASQGAGLVTLIIEQ
jgi:hypothetical protein